MVLTALVGVSSISKPNTLSEEAALVMSWSMPRSASSAVVATTNVKSSSVKGGYLGGDMVV